MGKAVPEQHPAVVLRSHYNHLRALLIAALIAVLGLAGAVVIVANDDQTDPGASSVGSQSALEKRWSAYDEAIRALTPEELAAAFGTGSAAPSQARPNQAQALPGQSQQAGQAASQAGATRYDGGPNEGSADVTMSPPIGSSAVQTQSPRYDGGPNEGSADIQFRGSKASANPQTGSPRYDGGPNEGSADVTTGSGDKAPVMSQYDGFHYSGD